MNVAELMVEGMDLELPDKLESSIYYEIDDICCITQEPITEGIPWDEVIPSSTGEYLDLMHGMAHKFMSIPAAKAYKGSWNMGSRLIFADGTMYHPYIAASSARRNERTYWSALVREVWPDREGQMGVCIIAGDFKKKIWPQAKAGPLGTNTPVLLYDPDRHVLRNVVVDWERLIAVLEFVEEVYAYGFAKDVIADSLFSQYGLLTEDLQLAMRWEDRLSELRGSPEFAVSILIAQKEGHHAE